MKKLLSLAICSMYLTCLSQQDLTQWRGPERNGIYPEKNLLTRWPSGGPSLLWKFDKMGKGYSSAAVTRDRVFCAGSVDSTLVIFSFDLIGNLLWDKKLGPEWNAIFPGTRSTPLICDGMGYITSGLGVLYCFDASTGMIKWKKDLFNEMDGKNIRWGFTENLVVDGNRLYCTPGGINANVVALDRMTGQVIWKSKGNGEVSACCSPIVIAWGGKKFFITMTENSLISIDTETGTLVWKHELEEDTHANTPIFHEGYLCSYDCSSEGRGGIMLKVSEDGKSIREVWKNTVIRSSQGDGVLIGDHLYRYSPTKKQLYCIDWKTGTEKFSYPLNTPLLTIIAAEGMLYCYSFTGDVYLFGIGNDSFELRGKFILPGNKKEHCAHPVIKDGKLFLRIDEILYVYAIAKTTS